MIGRIVSIGIAVVFCLFSSSSGIAQQDRVVDSLFKQLASSTDTTKVNILNKLSYKLYAIDQDKSNALAHQALDLSRKLKYIPGIVYASNNIGINYEHGGKLDKALETYFFALKILEGTGEPSWEASLLSNIGVVYIHQANYKKAAEYLEKGVHILDSLGKKDDAAPKLINLGAVYGRLGRYDDAQNAYSIALERFLVRNDKKNIAACYSNMGILLQKKEGSGKMHCPII